MKQRPHPGPPDPRGWLGMAELTAQQQRAEDATLAADLDRAETGWADPATGPGDDDPDTTPDRRLRWQYADSAEQGRVRCFHRPATPTERELLAALGHVVPDNLDTYVHYHSRGVRHRFWPDLETVTEGDNA